MARVLATHHERSSLINYSALKKITPAPLLPLLDRLENSAGGLRLASGMFWSVVGAVSSRAFGLVASIVAAQILGKTVFGELGMIQSTISMFATFATVGVGLTATKHVAEYRKKDPERAGRIIAMSSLVAIASGSVVGIIMIATSAWLAARLLAAPHLSVAIAISAFGLLFSVINEAQIGTLSGLEAFKRRSTIQFVAGIASFPIAVVGVYFFGLMGAVSGLIASQALLVFLNYRGIRKEAAAAGVPIRWREIKKEFGVLIGFSLPTLCCGAVYVPSMWIVNMMVVNTAGGYAEMGLFSAADRWRTAIMFIPTLLGGVTLPMLASLQGEAASRQYQKVLLTNIKLSVLASCAIAAPIALLAPWIMGSYGPGFREGTWVLVTLCIVSVAHAAYWIIGQSLVSHGRMWTMFSFNLGWAALLLSSGWYLREYGAMGLAIAYLIADSARLVWALIYLKRGRQVPGPVVLSDMPVKG